MRDYYKKNSFRNKNSFVENFPYDEYLKDVPFTDFKTLQEDRYFVWKKYKEGDIFLYHLGDYFIENYGIHMNKLKDAVDIGELYLSPKKGLFSSNEHYNRNINKIYQTMGYFILSKVGKKIEDEIKSGNFDPNQQDNKKLIERLEKKKVFISIEKGMIEKLIEKLSKGDILYIFDRFVLLYHPFLKDFAVYFVVIIGILAFIFFISWLKADTDKGKKVKGWLFVITAGLFVTPPVISLLGGFDVDEPVSNQITNPTYSMSTYSSGNISNGMELYTLKNASGKQIGHAIWMKRPYFKAKYYAYKDVYNKFTKTGGVVLATSGGFTNNEGLPEGLTVENGNIVNAVLMPDRDGLVVVSEGGGIRALNLKRDNFTLPDKTKIGHPFESLVAYSALLNWTVNTKATVFQTQLLAYSDKMLKLTARETRERRILAVFRNNKNDQLYHSIYNIPEPHQLNVIAGEIFAMLKKRDMKVEYMLNLDTGSYNILSVFDANGHRIAGIRGPVPVNKATNLIVYTR